MKKILSILTIFLALMTVVQIGHTQGTGPLFIIQGIPDSTTAPPEVRSYVSVINENTAQTIEELTAEDFDLKEAGTDVGTPSVSLEPVGLAIVVVMDRGGISAPGDERIGEATDLVRDLLDRMSVTGASDDDVIAIVGVGEDGVLEPEEDFTWNPVDTNRVRNALVVMEGEAVRGGTPLYEGLDEGLRLLTSNTDATMRSILAHRRKIIVVFSDGIDPDFSDTAREQDIIRKANDAGISIYAVGMAHNNGQLSEAAENNLERLASQTDGLYQLQNNDETHTQVLNLFDNLMTQRQQYLITYRTDQPKGDYRITISVETPIGSAEGSETFSSILERPWIALTSPSDGLRVTVPYSQTLEGFISTTVTLNTQVTAVDGVPRDPAEVRYFANGEYIGTSSSPPNYDFTWEVSSVVTPTEETQVQEYTLTAEADDVYLDQRMESAPVTIRVTWEPKEYTFTQQVIMWLSANWWLLLILIALALGLLVLLVLLFRTRSEVARKVIRTTTGVLKGVTKQLGGVQQRARGKLVVQQGAGAGREFRLAGQMVKVGRDPQFSDFALYDEYASNPHFSIKMEQTKFFIIDEGSTNGTRVNNSPIQAHQQVLLQPNAIIEVGTTKLQFKRLGGTTRQLGP